ncbi:two-component system response regulator YesN [Paenibacillus taihuensis]|uniref:Two-component system response regulator YesN n=1 Tax=Paenibacillus taihuensis TaxID=1156355 RepID=A0A3D9SNK4_9BACL|nr:response regulator [Paenibacillus taihuensis]REE93124.1 two-component system response regulator YesN [Paenibacillus taihuensis]
MLELLIVDDIPSQVDSIAATVPKEELGITAIHKAFSGEEALELFREHNINIVITDIRMPEMNGIELIKHIREMDRTVKIIVLSGYADFEYAQSVVPYNTSGYLMKPVNPDQLREKIGQLTEEIASETKQQRQQQRDVYAFRENLPALRSELLVRLLRDNGIPVAELARKLTLLGLPFGLQQEVGLFIVRLEGRLQEYENKDRELIEYAVANMAEEVFNDAFHLWLCRDSNEYLVFLAGSAGESGAGLDLYALENLAAVFKKKAEALLHDNLSVAIAMNGASFPEGMPGLYRSTIKGMRQAEDGKRGALLRIEDKSRDQNRIETLTSLYRPPLLIHLLDTGNWAGAEKKLVEIFDELKQAHYPPEHANEAYFSIANAYQYMAHKRGKLLSELGGATLGLMPAAPSLRQLEKWAFGMFRSLREQSEEGSEKQKVGLVDKIHAFIEQNLNDNLSLQTIAAHVSLHPAYLSRVYRAETGNNLSDYIQRYRMELAAYMLRSGEKRIYEIAQAVGYQGVPHFIKLFKAYSDLTPQEYRDRIGER